MGETATNPREARISELYNEIQQKQDELNKLRLESDPEPVEDHQLLDEDGNKVSLSSLFGESDELLVIHNMGKSCIYCTLWADGFRGYTEHLNRRMPFVLVSPDEPSVMKAFAAERGWNFECVSNHGGTFTRALGFEKEADGKTYRSPGASALVKDGSGAISRVSYDYFGPGDAYCPPWHFFKLFPKGDDNWKPV